MITFRTATPEDSDLIAKLVNSAYRGDSSKKGWTTEADLLGGQRTDSQKIIEMIEAPSSQMELAFDTELLGCVYLNLEDQNTLYLGMLTVNPELQARGLGKQLLIHAENIARQINCTSIKMTVISLRSELISFYERRGYILTGETEAFPEGDPRFGVPKRKLEFVVLTKTLN